MSESSPFLVPSSAPEGRPKKHESVLASQLVAGDWSVGHGKRIERVNSTQDGQLCIVFEQTPQEREEGREGTRVFVDRDELLDITRGN